MGRKRKIRKNPMDEYMMNCLSSYFMRKGRESCNADILTILRKMNEANAHDMATVKNKLTLNVLDKYTKHEIISSFLDYLPAKKKRMLEMKYKNKYSIVKIQMELEVSSDWVNRWSKILIDVLNDMFCYCLDKTSILACSRVQSMIRIIDMQLFFLEHKSLIVDISLDYIMHLRELQKNYVSIAQKLRDYLESDAHDIPSLIIQSLNEKYYTHAELAGKCFCTQSTIGVQIKNLQKIIFDEYNEISSHCSNIRHIK